MAESTKQIDAPKGITGKDSLVKSLWSGETRKTKITKTSRFSKNQDPRKIVLVFLDLGIFSTAELIKSDYSIYQKWLES